jgi:hypothetical protein
MTQEISGMYYVMDGVEIPQEQLRNLNPHLFDRSLPIQLPRIGDLVSVYSTRSDTIELPWGIVVGLSSRMPDMDWMSVPIDHLDHIKQQSNPAFWGPRNPPIDATIALTRPTFRGAYVSDHEMTWEKTVMVRSLAVISRADNKEAT